MRFTSILFPLYFISPVKTKQIGVQTVLTFLRMVACGLSCFCHHSQIRCHRLSVHIQKSYGYQATDVTDRGFDSILPSILPKSIS